MKGTQNNPACGFSDTVVRIMRHLKTDFVDVDVLSNETLRNEIKQYSDWPTFPQLFISGNLIGGCDIVQEMFKSGELQKIIDKAHKESSVDISGF